MGFFANHFEISNAKFKTNPALTNSLDVQLNFIFKSFHCLSAISKSVLSKIFIEQSDDLHIALDCVTLSTLPPTHMHSYKSQVSPLQFNNNNTQGGLQRITRETCLTGKTTVRRSKNPCRRFCETS